MVAEFDIPALVRSTLIFAHVLLLAGAAISIAFADYAVFRAEVVDHNMLAKASGAVIWVLCALWLTGLLIIGIDLQTHAISWLGTPKLQAKLCVVIALSTNGYFLHKYAIHSLGNYSNQAQKNARRDAILGAVSGVSWVYALFLGVAKPWAPVLGFLGFLTIYAGALFFAVTVALIWVRPILLSKSLQLDLELDFAGSENQPSVGFYSNKIFENDAADTVRCPPTQPMTGVANG
jgi:hypothetical protein